MEKKIIYILRYDYSNTDDIKYIVKTNNSYHADIENALSLMSFEFDNIKYVGYMDRYNHYTITSAINLVTGENIDEKTIDSMYYHAFCPECIGRSVLFK